MYNRKALVTTTDKIVKEGINNMGTKPNVLKKSITLPTAKNNIDTVNMTEKSQASNKKLIHPAEINLTTVNHWKF